MSIWATTTHNQKGPSRQPRGPLRPLQPKARMRSVRRAAASRRLTAPSSRRLSGWSCVGSGRAAGRDPHRPAALGDTISRHWISATTIWYVQIAAPVTGHVGGLILAHDRAVARWDDPRLALRSQYWMLAVMVAFTCLAPWLLSGSA
jgi:hypothetical protein